MKNVDVVIRTHNGSLQYNVDVDERLPITMAAEGIMAHHQLQGDLAALGVADDLTTLVVTTPGRLRGKLPPGYTLITEEGVSINKPLLSDVPRNLSVQERIELDRLFQNGSVVVSLLPESIQ